MDVPVQLPLDNGFLRRECPACEREFKWHHGPTLDRPKDAVDPDVYCCPYCGATAPPSSWWTKEQLEYAQRLAAGAVGRAMGDAVEDAFGHQPSDSFIRIDVTSSDAPEPPPALLESHDMTIVESPCHPWEPVKVVETWVEPLYCLLCGEKYAIE
jgi:hypothetical protein